MQSSLQNRFVALLRGINVGGNHKIKMDTLKKAFESFELNNVKTVLATGNVLFETDEKNEKKLTIAIREGLKKVFGYDISVLLRSMSDIEQLIKAEPFRGITVSTNTRLYVTFLDEEDKRKHILQIPYLSPEKDFTIIHASSSEVYCVLTLSENHRTTDAMNILEKEFGKKITTRNWNTIQKLAAL